VARVLEFIGSRDVSRAMRRGSIIAIKSEEQVTNGAKQGREAKKVHTFNINLVCVGEWYLLILSFSLSRLWVFPTSLRILPEETPLPKANSRSGLMR
jgi:hypothetical protein